MDSQAKTKVLTEEEFRSCYPDVSIQHLTEKGAKGSPNIDKRQPLKIATKPVVVPKSPTTLKTAVAAKLQSVKNSPSKTNLIQPKVNSPNVAKTPVAVKTPVMVKTPTVAKTPIAAVKTPTTPVVKTPQAVVKNVAVKTQGSALKPPQTKQTIPVKLTQNIVKTTQNVVKTPSKPAVVTTSVPAVQESAPDQSTTTVLTYHVPHSTPQRTSNQLTIEKIDHQQRIPVVLDANQVVLRQVINSGQVVVQNKLPAAETAVQSVVIGTTAPTITPVVAEITTSEPLQALQVTQQVTLYTPKGNTFTVDDVKKQLIKQNAMTNVVSSTTNPVPAPVAGVQEQKKPVTPARAQAVVHSPLRQSKVKINQQVRSQQKPVAARNYQSTRGQVSKVNPKRDIPMQKVSPMQPPPLPPPELQLGSEEEVTTSEEIPQERQETKLIVILPSGERKHVSINNESMTSCTIQDLLNTINVPIPENLLNQNVMAEIFPSPEAMAGNETHWDGSEQNVSEPGEILGVGGDVGVEDSTELRLSSEMDTSQKEIENANGEPDQEGLLAVCPACGYSSVDLNKCLRCTRKIPPNCKTVSEGLDQKSRKTKADSLTGDSPKKKKVCRKRRMEEPVCLTISDDEELLGLAHAHAQPPEESFHSDSNSQLSSCDKEPVITDEMITELKQSVSGGGVDMELALENVSAEEKTFLQCRTVRIGSYKVVPKDKVLITPHGLKVTVPVLNSDQSVELKILYNEIIKVLIHFGRQMPVLFFYTRPAAAAKIRKALKMDDKNGFYYDSTSSNETHRRITFLPDKIDEDCKQTLKTIFSNPENNVFAELSGKEANDILVKASPKEVQAFILKKQPNQQQQQPQQPQPFNGQNIQTIMVYPPPPEKGGIPINTEDYACLGEDQFLNDVIIDFYLKYVVEKTLSPADRARTHVFSSFFYKRLTTKPPPKRKSMNPVENDPTATPAAKRHSRVKSWTKNVNLFTKDFIVIPINENSHWFLAIICFPGLTGPVRFSDNTPIDLPGRKKKPNGKHTVTIGSTTITAVSPSATLDDVEDRDEADGEDEDMDVPDEDEDGSQKPSVPEIKEEPVNDPQVTNRKKEREPIKQPCILIFDSLAGASRSRVVATLRDYLRVEYEVKHGETRNFGGDVMKGTNLRCPQQTNYTDCGLYVLQYVEAFFLWPVTDYHIPITQLQDWFQADIVSRKRYDIQQLLHRLMQEQGIDIEALNLPLLNLRPEGKHLVECSGTEEDEDDEEEEEEMGDEEEDDMMDDDGEYNDEIENEHEEMEEGEIVHHDEDDEDPDQFLDPHMDHDEDQDMDEEDYGMEDEEEDLQEEDEMVDKELDDLSLAHMGGPLKKKDLKHYRIPRLVKNDMINNSFKEDLQEEDEMVDKELDDLSLAHMGGPLKKKDLKHYRIPRLVKNDMINNSFKED
uniref:Ubiquitin-like protease family profile domain-containing protein n=2 Tax=Cuerna arida TaxID=1464854 RepID=A0A1B6GPP2_9HEMI